MPVWSIILDAFIFAGAIGFSLWKNFLPRRFTLFGVKYGDKFSEMSGKLKLKVIIIYVMTVVFSVANIVVPWRIFRTYYRDMKQYLFLLVYIVCIIIWLVVLTRKNIAKKYYEKEIRNILDNTPLYMAVVNFLRNSRTDKNGFKSKQHAYRTVVPCNDGVALFFRKIEGYNYTTMVEGTSKGACRVERDAWQKATEREWASIYSVQGASAVFPAADFGYEELSHQDKKDFCVYLAREDGLDLEHEELQFSREFECQYTIVTTYDSGRTEYDDKSKSASGAVFVHAAIAKEEKEYK